MSDPARAAELMANASRMEGAGQHGNALALLTQAVEVAPDMAPAWDRLGLCLQSLKKYNDAVLAHRQARSIDPLLGSAAHNLGLALNRSGQRTQAIQTLEAAINEIPQDPSLYRLLGMLWADSGQLSKARSVYEAGLAIGQPDLPLQTRHSIVLIQLGERAAGIAGLEQVLQQNPDHIRARYSLAVALQEQGQHAAAIGHYQQVLQRRSDHIQAANNLAQAAMAIGQWGLAQRVAQALLQALPNHPIALALPHIHRCLCLWDGLEKIDAQADALFAARVAAGQRTQLAPLMHIERCADPLTNLQVAQEWSKRVTLQPRFSHGQPTARPTRLHIGYLSNDFRDHPVGHLVAALFDHHDSDRFQITAYGHGPNDGSAWRQRIESSVETYRDLHPIGVRPAAEQIHADGVHILIDLMGHTTGARPGICAQRPAPIQVNWLGYPGTSGAPFMDYIIGDPIVSPPDEAHTFSERLALMPDCYQSNDDQVDVPTAPDRASVGLPEQGLVLCSFNQSFKLDPVLFGVWMDVLKAQPDSVLWLLCRHRRGRENLAKEAQRHGVDSSRLIFAERVSKQAHLARMQLADLALDTRIYNGHTTTSDALRCGVPVLTLKGHHFASRVSESLLHATGMGELVCADLDQYREQALALCSAPEQLKSIRSRILHQNAQAPLFDTARFCRNLEGLLDQIWSAACRPDHSGTPLTPQGPLQS